MKKLKVYEYSACSTCKKALKFLDSRKVPYERIDITSTPPSVKEIETMLGHLDSELKKLFNTSGQQYRELKISEKLPSMDKSAAVKLLSSNGRLVKRPFVLGDGWGAVGFKEEEWKRNL